MTHFRICLAVVGILGWASAFNAGSATAQTILDTYVAAPDAFSTVGLGSTYSVDNTIVGAGYTASVLDMTSQSWRAAEGDVSPSDWQHWLTVIKPTTVVDDTALLFVTGGSNTSSAPSSVGNLNSALVSLALSSNTVVVELRMVPSQRTVFAGDLQLPGGRVEDELIAYTFDQYLDNYTTTPSSNDTWPALLPMTKSAVRAMDTVQDFVPQAFPGTTINDFVVSGASKRGWTTWLTAATDAATQTPRVKAIVPIVIDLLNTDQSMAHHVDSYGFYAPAVQDYDNNWGFKIMDRLDSPEGQALLKAVDPYEYRDRLTMPKYLVNSTGDQFFLPDSSQFYFDDLLGQNYLRYVPNTDHSLSQSPDALEGIGLYYDAIINDLVLPTFSWTVEDNGEIRVVTDPGSAPLQVNLWQATNPTARDFRLETIGAAWTDSLLADQGGGLYIGSVPDPASGFTAYMVELLFQSPVPGSPYKFTTEITVSPHALVGDISGDGVVDIGDFTLWADAFGNSGSGLSQDLTVDGVVDIGDFTVWADHFGNTANVPASPSAVPEPSSLVLCAFGTMGLLAVTWRRRRRSTGH